MKNRHLLILAAALPLGAAAAPVSVSFKAPAAGAVLTGVYQDSPACEATGNGIDRVEFFLGAAKLNTELNPTWNCSFDSRAFANGAYVLKAVAYDKRGRSATAQVNVTVKNNAPPAVSLNAPAAGATLTGLVEGAACEALASDSDGTLARVDFYLGSRLVTSSAAAPYQCSFNSAAFPNGLYALMAVATDDEGASTSAQRSVTLQNADAPPAPAVKPLDAADILTQALSDTPFAQQTGYNVQVIGTAPYVTDIADSGIHYSTLPNGETLRFGKVVDPENSVLTALAVQVHRDDPNTSGAKRTEIRAANNIEMDQVYWLALSTYVYDWGTLAANDSALFGMQLHSGNNNLDLSPSISINTTNSGRNFNISVLHSTASTPSQSNTVKAKYADQPIPFGRWVDWVFKLKQSLSGAGFVQVWMDGTQIVDHQGNVGFNTPGYVDYLKFGYYNWSGSAMGATARKVLLRSPTLVADPTGKYAAEDLRAHLHPAP
jgi:hypothetical protein